MKHTAIRPFAAGLLSLLLLSSCAGGAESELSSPEASRTASSPSAAAVQESPADETPSAEAEDEAEENEEAEEVREEEAPMTEEEVLAVAMEYIGRPVDELISVIGEPEDRDYAPSCMGDGEDGNLYYAGFIVYTYRENGEETVQDVE